MVAASLWSLCWISTGYLLGEAVAQLLQEFAQIGRWLFVGAAIVIAIVAFIFLRRRGEGKAAKTRGKAD